VKLGDEAEARFRKEVYARPGPSIEGVRLAELRRFSDDSGSMTELARLGGGTLAGFEPFSVAQVNYSTLEPGAIKAFHVHHLQTDIWYVPPEDRVLVVLVDVRRGSATESARMRLVLGDTRSVLLRIPPGVAHGCRNLAAAPGRILYFTDRQFSPEPERTDEGRLPWDFLGPEVWEPTRG
jgi:dTDP-4-dehydrorhamnose 3,5-epimerase